MSARERGLRAEQLEVGAFRLRTFARADEGARGGRLHIYLDGDGRPFVTPRRIARDPTPSEPLVLDLMQADPEPAVYLGRPCYHGLQSACDPRDWTIARYGPRMVDALAAAVTRIAAERQVQDLVLIGYSGGGVLAVLIAERVPAVSAVMTVAANLDVDAWTDMHGFSPLEGSLNPATRPRASHAPALHLSGEKDRSVPPAAIQRYRARVPEAVFVTVPGFGHTCCWARDWPQWLDRLDVIRASTEAAAVPPSASPASTARLPPDSRVPRADPDASPENRRSP
jgi:pimeloyl-ACP methyl ester carboxylesterase